VTGQDQKTRRDSRIAPRYPGANALESARLSGPDQEVAGSPAILDVKADHGASKRKVEQVLVKVYEPERLQLAWQQVRKNAGAAGIDRMTIEEFSLREEALLGLIHDKLQSGTYRFQPVKRVLIPKPGTTNKRKLGGYWW